MDSDGWILTDGLCILIDPSEPVHSNPCVRSRFDSWPHFRLIKCCNSFLLLAKKALPGCMQVDRPEQLLKSVQKRCKAVAAPKRYAS